MSDDGFSDDLFGFGDAFDTADSSASNWWDVPVTPAVQTGWDQVNVTPPVQTTDYNSSSGSDWSNILKAIPLIGQTFASTLNSVNNPSAPTAYSGPGPSPGDIQPGGTTQRPNSLSTLFSQPLPWIIVGGIVLLVVLNRSND